MTLVAAAGVGAWLWLVLILGCPLMMLIMMRGMHGGPEHGAGAKRREEMTLEELKAERDALKEEIGQRAEQSASAGNQYPARV